jgi:nucleotide-binding universal stress UspA family protein
MKLLIAIDGSPSSLNALRHAIRWTEGMVGPHHFGLLNVHTPPSVPFDIQGLSHGMINDYLERVSTEELAAARELAQATHLSFEILRRRGHPANEIVSVAVNDHFELIVMGTKGRSHFADTLLGSVAQRVASMAPMPVLLVPASAA